MKTVREIIQEACVRINLVPRRQAVAGDIVENGFRLLQGIIAKYNSDNLLSWTLNHILVKATEMVHIYDTDDTLIPENYYVVENLDDINDYEEGNVLYNKTNGIFYKVGLTSQNARYGIPMTNVLENEASPYYADCHKVYEYTQMKHVKVSNVAKINSIYTTTDADVPYKEFYKLDFVPYSDFDNWANTSRIFTTKQVAENEWIVYFKPRMKSENYRLKINYNEGIEIDLNTDLYIPDNYIELLIVALAHKLALQYPRLDEAQMNRLEQEVRVLVDNVRTPKASNQILQREDYFDDRGGYSQYDLMAGRFW